MLDRFKKVIPKKLVKLVGQWAEGPNCWNTTIVFCQPSKRRRFTPGVEMDQWLKDNTETITEKQARHGDIIVFRAPDHYNTWLTDDNTDLVHTVVILGKQNGETIVYQKEGFVGQYRIDTLAHCKKVYSHTSVFEYKRFTGKAA